MKLLWFFPFHTLVLLWLQFRLSDEDATPNLEPFALGEMYGLLFRLEAHLNKTKPNFLRSWLLKKVGSDMLNVAALIDVNIVQVGVIRKNE